MTEAKREERRKSQRESYLRCKARKESEPKLTSRDQQLRKSQNTIEVFPLKDEQDIMAMQLELLRGGKWRYRNFLYFILGISLGRRGGDIAKLRWKDLLDSNGDFIPEGPNIIEEKTGKRSFVTFNSDAEEAIAYYLKMTGTSPEPDEYVFKSAIKGEDYIDVGSMRKIFKKAAKAIGFKRNFGTHSLRKTFGYRLWIVTQNLSYVQMILGHSDPAITRRYIGLDEDMIREAGNKISGIVLPEVSAAVTGMGMIAKPQAAFAYEEGNCQIIDFMAYRRSVAV